MINKIIHDQGVPVLLSISNYRFGTFRWRYIRDILPKEKKSFGSDPNQIVWDLSLIVINLYSFDFFVTNFTISINHHYSHLIGVLVNWLDRPNPKVEYGARLGDIFFPLRYTQPMSFFAWSSMTKSHGPVLRLAFCWNVSSLPDHSADWSKRRSRLRKANNQ